MRRLALALLAISMLLPACGRGRIGGGGGGDDDDDQPGGSGLVSGLDIVRVTINQGVEVDLLDGDTEVSHNAPVVASRPGVVRVYVEQQDDWDPREVVAILDLDDGSTYSASKAVNNSPSSEGQLNSTINIELDGDALSPGLGFSIRIEEAASGSYPGNSNASRLPADEGDTFDLGVQSSGILDLRIVPIRYNADNSGRLPATGDAAIQRIVDGMMGLYPASEVRVTIDPVYDYAWGVNPNFAGWEALLNTVYEIRASRNHPGNSYTYGLFAPAEDRYAYCGGGCVAGLSWNVQQASWDDARVSIGLGWDDEATWETMAHEVGHAHGRNHAPCTQFGNINNVDPSFPHSGGVIGVPGYDVVDGNLTGASQAYDIMGYCDPIWVSDYTYDAFFDRIRAIGPSAQLDGGQLQDWLLVSVGEDGLHSPRLLLDRPPVRGTNGKASMRDVDGFELGEVDVRFMSYDHAPGGTIVMPAPPPGVQVIDVQGFGSLEL